LGGDEITPDNELNVIDRGDGNEECVPEIHQRGIEREFEELSLMNQRSPDLPLHRLAKSVCSLAAVSGKMVSQ
jgi:hypothetical protein